MCMCVLWSPCSHKAKSMAKASARSLKSMQSKSRSRAGAAQVAAQNQEYLGE
jgi:hypothetical protein